MFLVFPHKELQGHDYGTKATFAASFWSNAEEDSSGNPSEKYYAIEFVDNVPLVMASDEFDSECGFEPGDAYHRSQHESQKLNEMRGK
jgi:hypothetical protein